MRRIALALALCLVGCGDSDETTPTPTPNLLPNVPTVFAVKRTIPHQVAWNGQTFDITLTWLLLQEWHWTDTDSDGYVTSGTVTETVCAVQSSEWFDPQMGDVWSFQFPASWWGQPKTYGGSANPGNDDNSYSFGVDNFNTSIGGNPDCSELLDTDGDNQPGATFLLENKTWIHGCYYDQNNGNVFQLTNGATTAESKISLVNVPIWSIEGEESMLEGMGSNAREIAQQHTVLPIATCQAVISAYN